MLCEKSGTKIKNLNIPSLEDNDHHKRGNDDSEYASSANEGEEGILKAQKKRGNAKDEDDGELENDDPSTSKKPRVVWSVELHQQFVSAVNQLGLDSMIFNNFFPFIVFYQLYFLCILWAWEGLEFNIVCLYL